MIFSNINSSKDYLSPLDIAKYFYLRADFDGELISPLKMQKMVYFAYVEYLKITHEDLFLDRIEAWPMGPVIVNLYHELKKFGSLPIDDSFVCDIKDTDSFLAKFKPDTKKILDSVYEKYIVLSPFELVAITHAQEPWINARKGLSPGDKSDKEITKDEILAYDC